MRNAIRLLSLAVLFAPLASAQSTKLEVNNLPDHPFQVDYTSGSQLNLYVRSGDVRVVGSTNNKISVRLDAKGSERAREVKVRFERSDRSAALRIWGGPRNNLKIIVEVPRAMGLFVRMPFGQLEITDITGDKDVQLHAGELILGVGNPADYSRVDASVNSGGLEAPPFGEDHGGLFRSFQKTGNGKYKLRAHVGAGDLTMR
jgi:hypothetical protein